MPVCRHGNPWCFIQWRCMHGRDDPARALGVLAGPALAFLDRARCVASGAAEAASPHSDAWLGLSKNGTQSIVAALQIFAVLKETTPKSSMTPRLACENATFRWPSRVVPYNQKSRASAPRQSTSGAYQR